MLTVMLAAVLAQATTWTDEDREREVQRKVAASRALMEQAILNAVADGGLQLGEGAECFGEARRYAASPGASTDPRIAQWHADRCVQSIMRDRAMTADFAEREAARAARPTEAKAQAYIDATPAAWVANLSWQRCVYQGNLEDAQKALAADAAAAKASGVTNLHARYEAGRVVAFEKKRLARVAGQLREAKAKALPCDGPAVQAVQACIDADRPQDVPCFAHQQLWAYWAVQP